MTLDAAFMQSRCEGTHRRVPEAHSFRSQVQRFNVSVDGKSGIRPEKVMALDKELEKNLKDDFASTMTRTAIRVVLRTIASQAAKKAMK